MDQLKKTKTTKKNSTLRTKTALGPLTKHIHYTIKTFIKAFHNEIENLPKNNTQRKYNLTKDEREALEKFQQRDDIIITNADKGGDKYIEEANSQLHDETFYKKCNTDLTQRHNKLINHTIDSFKNLYHIDEQTSKMLRTTYIKETQFYTLPKSINLTTLDAQSSAPTLSHSKYIQICRLPSARPCKKTTFLYQGHHRLYQQN